MTRILVIEDEEAVRSDIIDILHLEGYDVYEAENGKIGIILAEKHLPDLIICDIMMPEADGYEVLDTLRRNPKTAVIPFLFLTAKADRKSQRLGMTLGADDFITKPFALPELVEAIHARLQRQIVLETASADKLKQARDNMMKMVSERLKQPMESMTTVMDVIRLQMGMLAPEDLGDLLETMDYGNRRLSRLVDEIVLSVQLDSGAIGQIPIEKNGAVVPLREIWMFAIDDAQKYATERSDVAIYTEEVDEHISIRCDQTALRYAFSKVIGNALIYANARGDVTITQWVCDGDFGCVQIKDDGVGLSEEDMERAFANSAEGMGLTLVKRIVEAHGGQFYLRSAPQKGTQVTLRLPLHT